MANERSDSHGYANKGACLTKRRAGPRRCQQRSWTVKLEKATGSAAAVLIKGM